MCVEKKYQYSLTTSVTNKSEREYHYSNLYKEAASRNAIRTMIRSLKFVHVLDLYEADEETAFPGTRVVAVKRKDEIFTYNLIITIFNFFL